MIYFYWVALGFLLVFAGLFLGLLDFAEFSWILLDFDLFLLDSTGLSLVFAGLFLGLLDFAEFSWNLLDFDLILLDSTWLL